MLFFEAQKRARQKTGQILLLFAAGLLLLIAATYLIIHTLLLHAGLDETLLTRPIAATGPFTALTHPHLELLLYTGGILTLITAAGIAYKTSELSGGGRAIVNALHGQLIMSTTKDPRLKQLHNIVEEMSIASGVPVPQLYLIPDDSINAFAAGRTTDDAIIGVTQGALRAFNRDEMQGVIAHEFSHILNGDMRLNLRLIIIIYGIMFMSYLGYFLLRGGAYSSLGHRRRSGGGDNTIIIIMSIGAALAIIGFIGSLLGSFIRAAISRQREFLADASAVQFTRNPLGIAAALDRIKRHTAPPQQPKNAEYAHLFFANAVASKLTNPFATHPPLQTRIQRILPQWDGKSAIATEQPVAPTEKPAAAPPKPTPAEWLTQIGVLSAAGLRASAEILRQTPPPLEAALEDSYSARALIYALLIDKNPTHRTAQLTHLATHADTGVHALTQKLLPVTETINRKTALALVQRALPTLHTLTAGQCEKFLENIATLITLDNTLDLFEWCLEATVTHALLNHFPHLHRPTGRADANDHAYALSILAQSGKTPATAFQAAAKELPFPTKDPQAPLDRQHLFAALSRLSRLPPEKKEPLIRACITCINSDNRIDENESLLLRAYLGILDCPLPADLT